VRSDQQLGVRPNKTSSLFEEESQRLRVRATNTGEKSRNEPWLGSLSGYCQITRSGEEMPSEKDAEYTLSKKLAAIPKSPGPGGGGFDI